MRMLENTASRFTAAGGWVLLCALFLSAGAQAQNQVEVNFMGMYPQGEFSRQVSRSFGISGGYTRVFLPWSRIALQFGGDAGYVTYGKDTTTLPYSTDYPEYTVDVQINNNVAQFGLVGKAALEGGRFRPYIEGKVGYSYFFTETKILDSNSSSTVDTSGLGNMTNTTTYRALGAGLLIPVYTGTSEEGSPGRFAISIDLRVLYWWGNTVDYMVPGSITVNSGSGALGYNPIHTRTDMTSFHVGAAVDF